MLEHLVGRDAADEFAQCVQSVTKTGGDEFGRRHAPRPVLEDQLVRLPHRIEGSLQGVPVMSEPMYYELPYEQPASSSTGGSFLSSLF